MSGMVERFRPGGVRHALVSGLVEAAMASVCAGASQAVSRSSQPAATSLAAAAIVCGVLALVSFASAALRARVLGADLDDEAVVVRTALGERRFRYGDLSAVELAGGRTRLVTRQGRSVRVRGVRGAAQGGRFRARVLARATEAARGTTPARPVAADRLPPGGEPPED